MESNGRTFLKSSNVLKTDFYVTYVVGQLLRGVNRFDCSCLTHPSSSFKDEFV